MGLTKSPNSGVLKTTKSPRPPVGSEELNYVIDEGGPDITTGVIEPEAPAEAPENPLFALTNAELQEMAEYEGVELPPRATKAEMVAAIEAIA